MQRCTYIFSAIVFSFGHFNGVFCEINMKYPYRAHSGLAFPNYTEVIEGQNMMFKLLISRLDQESCIIKTPDFVTHDLRFKNSKVEHWSDGCGVIIKNIQKKDEGRWRLTSKNKTGHTEGLFTIVIKDVPKNPDEEVYVDLFNEDYDGVIDIKHGNSSYCYLTHQETGQSIFVHGNCTFKVKDFGKNLQGSWIAHTGFPGIMEESLSNNQLNIISEEVIVGMTIDRGIVHMYCNLRHSNKTVNFCRFQRLIDGKGFNLEPGVGKDYYSYYGAGLHVKECGLTLENPKDIDYGSWKCSIGVTVGKNITSIIHRSLMLNRPRSKIIGNRVLPREILGADGKEVKITCHANTTISYCLVKHPNQTEFHPITSKDGSDMENTENPYWYSTAGYNTGECVFTLRKGTESDNGLWKCMMGSTYMPGPEIIDSIRVRIGSQLAAVYPVTTVKFDESITLSCITAGGSISLNYCRFLTPEGIGFNIDSKVTEDQPILNEYYFPKDASLYRGDCAVTIMKVKNHHLGRWTCAAIIDKDIQESSDFIILQPQGGNLSAASATGIAIGLVVLVGLAGTSGYFVWRRKRNTDTAQHRNLSMSPGSPAEVSVQFTGRPSAGSDTSSTQLTMVPEIRMKQYGASTSTQ